MKHYIDKLRELSIDQLTLIIQRQENAIALEKRDLETMKRVLLEKLDEHEE